MTNQLDNTKISKKENIYDLEERTSKFSIRIIKFSKQTKINFLNKPLFIQLIKSATSIGANYCEADEAESKKDFKHKIGICKKEARETCYWLKLIANALPIHKEKLKIFYQESKELRLIFNAIIYSSKNNA